MKNKWGRWLLLSAFAIVFEDVPKFEDFNWIQQYLKQTKKVSDFVMTRAKKGQFEYRGDYAGSNHELLETINAAVNERFKIETTTEEELFKITLTPAVSE